MTSSIKSKRIESIDILRGLVMVIMALDHVRDYFHLNGFIYDPTNLDTTTPELFFTRFITHFCAPVFIFLSGTSAFLYGRNKSKGDLSKFLFTRGLWLVFVEIVIMNFLWWFDPSFGFINLQVIWAIGICMIVLSLLIHLPKRILLVLGLLIVFGHNFLDGISMQGTNFNALLWYALHQGGFVPFSQEFAMAFTYPILAWIGIIALGYCFGQLYTKDFKAVTRKKNLLFLGLSAIALFFILRAFNIYGESNHWSQQSDLSYTIISFFNVTKYPPSLLFLFITLGPALLFIRWVETIKNKFTDVLLVYGRVPFFYYVLHILVIHLAAMVGLELTGGSWKQMILTNDVFMQGKLVGYGYSLFTTYLVWIGIVILLYFPSKAYMTYKLKNKDKWWLSYL
ncbi:DUF1624 domain-containing protein [Winogradskyella sp. A3E31]|uniref:DUF1624 domain-containing protein n=1 Tax=Winogradskyella sp. A3E31 TaxID=3349637 RepID=UPI00398AF682